ncbi:MAG: helix-turn-helix transcriptional regulator [Methyloceanibacter sp.]|nr:helix-turn-helix transcriptional regulator [Methyloceanibacter sp.]
MELNRAKAIGKRLQEARKWREWSQQTMAYKLGVETQRYAKWEQRGNFPLDRLEEFCDLTGASVQFIILGVHPGEQPPRPEAPAPVQ